jgi:hypothetical protein
MNTLGNERRAFMQRLQREPAFLSQHVPAIAAAVGRRLTTRLTGLRKDKHRGRKLELPSLRAARRSQPGASSDRRGTIWPLYARVPQVTSVSTLPPAGADGGDREDVFLANRWGFLVTALLEDRIDAIAPLEECGRWIDNHEDRSAAVWEPYSAGERVANLAVFIAALPEQTRARAWTPKLVAFTQASLDWIRGHVEYYGPLHTSNHILNNARAFVLGGCATGDDAWVDAGLAIFREWLPALVGTGGFLRERSSHYQLVVLNWVLDAWHFARAHGLRPDDAMALEATAIRMLEAAAMVCDAGGELLARIGDVSPDATPEQSSARLRALYPHLWPPPPSAARPVTLTDGWFKLSEASETVLGNFPNGLYPPPFLTHGHGDLTSFTWTHGAREILVDPGRYRYTADETSLFQKSAAAHNAPLVNGMAPVAETLVANGMWWPMPYSAARLAAAECSGGVELAHDGFARATPVSLHRRRIMPSPGSLEVVDEFDGAGSVALGFCWHFGDDFERFDAAALTAVGPSARLRLVLDGLAAAPRVDFANGAAPGGYTSPRYGERRPSLGLCLGFEARLPVKITTRFVLQAS